MIDFYGALFAHIKDGPAPVLIIGGNNKQEQLLTYMAVLYLSMSGGGTSYNSDSLYVFPVPYDMKTKAFFYSFFVEDLSQTDKRMDHKRYVGLCAVLPNKIIGNVKLSEIERELRNMTKNYSNFQELLSTNFVNDFTDFIYQKIFQFPKEYQKVFLNFQLANGIAQNYNNLI